MGTMFTITLYAEDSDFAEQSAKAAFHRIADLEDIMSDYQADSELNLLCEKPPGKPVPISADLFDVLWRGQEVSRVSDGAFDVTIGPNVRLWRFARKRKVLPTAAELASAKDAVGFRKLGLDPKTKAATLLVPNMRLDVGGIAKGYAADQALKLLEGRGINRALVAASGDLAIGDPPPGKRGWRIAITGFAGATNHVTHPLLLRNAGVSTSGDSEQFVEIGGLRNSHIVNPATGLGLTNRIQATVVARDATTSDALATTVCIVGPSRSIPLANKLPGVSTLIFTPENGNLRTFVSRRFHSLPVAE
jgi:FAD:protein FMN transferase